MYKVRSSDLRTEPCGTPYEIVGLSETVEKRDKLVNKKKKGNSISSWLR